MRKQGFPVIALLAGLYILIAILLFGFFSGSQTRNILLQQYQLEQGLAQMLTMLQFNPDMEIAQGRGDLPFQITGIGIYDQEGNSIFVRGQAPAVISMSRGEAREDLMNMDDSDRIVYIRRFPVGLPGRIAETGPDQSPVIRDAERSVSRSPVPVNGLSDWRLTRRPMAMYIEAIPLEQSSAWSYSWPAYAVIISLLGIGFVFFAHVYFRNQQYRQVLLEQESLVTLGEAARTISHEIKNPLSAIGLRLSILKSQSNAEAQEDLGIIQQEVQRLERLSSKIGQFLNNPGGVPEPVNLKDFIQNLAKRYPERVHFSAPGIETEGDETLVFIDPDHLRSIVENILVNALEADPSGTVRIELQRKKHWVRLYVIDSGPGIVEELGDRIFSPFVTTKARGSGIGLAIAQRFAEAAGGSLEWKSNPEGGAIMIVSLPEHI
ncbi:sensor histidine kinase [Spirochaeta dissipatitropha]